MVHQARRAGPQACGFFPSWNAPQAPAPPEEGQRARFVVLAVAEAMAWLAGGRVVEREWRVELRRAEGGMLPTYALHVVQGPDAPAPYKEGEAVEIDPRLLEEMRT